MEVVLKTQVTKNALVAREWKRKIGNELQYTKQKLMKAPLSSSYLQTML